MKRSTIKLLFCHDHAYQKSASSDNFIEVEDIFNTKDIHNNSYAKNRFQDSRFWRSISTRYWQYDDFTFNGPAAASFLGNAHRYKIWFNPLEVYKLLITSAMGLYDTEKVVPKKSSKNKNRKNSNTEVVGEVTEKSPDIDIDTEWENLVSGKSIRCNELKCLGWSSELWEELVKSKEQKSWTDKGWYLWNYSITNYSFISVNVVSVMVHEMMHVLWQHLKRGKVDPYHWNLSTDYSINQILDFTPEVRKVCITSDNETFFNRFVISYVRYHLQNNPEDRERIESKYKININQDIKEFCEKAYPHINSLYSDIMVDSSTYQRTDITSKKPADFYYRILEETIVFKNQGEGEGEGKGKGQGKGIRGYNNHEDWDNECDDGEGEDDNSDGGEDESNGNGKGNSDSDSDSDSGKEEIGNNANNNDAVEGGKIDQIRKQSKGSKGKKATENSKGGSNVKDRGNGEGVGSPHGGWDVTTACARQEVKGSLRDAMKRSGFNPDNPEDIKKCLDRTPGMESLGAYITEWFKVPTKNWRQILSHYIATAMKPQQLDYTMSRENRRLPGVFPGMRREKGLELIIAVDTSGSINYNDYNDFIGQIQKIGKDCEIDTVRFIQCHHSIALDKKMPLRRVKSTPVVETGGTTLACIWHKLKNEKNRKLLLCFTDGCIDVFLSEGWGFKSIMFLSRGNECYAQSLRDRGFITICQDQE